jgi:hypothetical protein
MRGTASRQLIRRLGGSGEPHELVFARLSGRVRSRGTFRLRGGWFCWSSAHEYLPRAWSPSVLRPLRAGFLLAGGIAAGIKPVDEPGGGGPLSCQPSGRVVGCQCFQPS